MKTILTAVACIIAATDANLLAAQLLNGVRPIFVDYVSPPPAQIDQFAAAVDAVVRVRIESIAFDRSVDALSGRPRDVTKYKVGVLDTPKAHSMLPSNEWTFTITRVGGQHLENGKTIVTAQVGFEDFQQLGEYVFFLTWNEHRNDFDIAYGPNGSFQLLPTGVVRPLGQSDVAKAQQGKRLDAFLQELKVASERLFR